MSIYDSGTVVTPLSEWAHQVQKDGLHNLVAAFNAIGGGSGCGAVLVVLAIIAYEVTA